MDDDVQLFVEESKELLSQVESILLKSEKHRDDESMLVDAFGAIHTIKGNSMYLNLDVLIKVCKRAESIFVDENRAPRLINDKEYDLLFKFVDLLQRYLDDLLEGNNNVGLLNKWGG